METKSQRTWVWCAGVEWRSVVSEQEIREAWWTGRENRSAAGSELPFGGWKWKSDPTHPAEENRCGNVESEVLRWAWQCQRGWSREEEDLRPPEHQRPGTSSAGW